MSSQETISGNVKDFEGIAGLTIIKKHNALKTGRKHLP